MPACATTRRSSRTLAARSWSRTGGDPAIIPECAPELGYSRVRPSWDIQVLGCPSRQQPTWTREPGIGLTTPDLHHALIGQTIDVDAAVIGRAIDAAFPDDGAIELGMRESVLRAPVLAVPDHLEPFGTVRIGREILCVINQEATRAAQHVAVLVGHHRHDDAVGAVVGGERDAPA